MCYNYQNLRWNPIQKIISFNKVLIYAIQNYENLSKYFIIAPIILKLSNLIIGKTNFIKKNLFLLNQGKPRLFGINGIKFSLKFISIFQIELDAFYLIEKYQNKFNPNLNKEKINNLAQKIQKRCVLFVSNKKNNLLIFDDCFQAYYLFYYNGHIQQLQQCFLNQNTQSQLKLVHLRNLQNCYQLIESRPYQSQINQNLSKLLEAQYIILTIVHNQKISNQLRIQDMYQLIVLLNMINIVTVKVQQQYKLQQQDSDINNMRFKQIIDNPSFKNSNHIVSYEKSSFSQHFRITSQRSSPQSKKLFVDIVKGTDKIKTDLVCPYSPQLLKSQQQIISGYLKDLAKKRRKPQGIDARLDFEAELIYSALTQDGDLAKKIFNKSGSQVKQIFRNILATGYDQQMYYLNRIRSIHQD
ncbi:unnamed protein product [Paramecium pentaurelia]|uniref:Uncharacterized protein n=1 Tax=Paramecium pentaurelia TaxID=43138 RepID=A0A8S1VEC2_9CILI|nr:unnamed protein product [Paramecium pentaurelia]